MIKLFTQMEFENTKSKDSLPFQCKQCSCTFYVIKKYITRAIKNTHHEHKIYFCSTKCAQLSRNTSIKVNCVKCNKIIKIKLSKRSKSGNNFCSSSCAAIYNNTHKTKGNRRSKLEIWLETQLLILYPNLDLIFNCKEIINSELDIYIPSLQLAFELNGIFHYEPIYGPEKLSSIQNNDNRKFQACLEQHIELVIIDTSNQKYFKESNSKKYLEIILNIIKNKLMVVPLGYDPSTSALSERRSNQMN